MAVASETTERVDVSQPMDSSSPSRLAAADLVSEASSVARPSFSADSPDRNDSANSSPGYGDPQVWIFAIFFEFWVIRNLLLLDVVVVVIVLSYMQIWRFREFELKTLA